MVHFMDINNPNRDLSDPTWISAGAWHYENKKLRDKKAVQVKSVSNKNNRTIYNNQNDYSNGMQELKCVFESILEPTKYGDQVQVKNYTIGKQLFRATVKTYNTGTYIIERLGNDGHWETLEFEDNYQISKHDIYGMDHKIIFYANWHKTWLMVENKIINYYNSMTGEQVTNEKIQIADMEKISNTDTSRANLKCFYADPENIGLKYTIEKYDPNLPCENCGKIGSYYMVNEKYKIGCCLVDIVECKIFSKIIQTTLEDLGEDVHDFDKPVNDGEDFND